MFMDPCHNDHTDFGLDPSIIHRSDADLLRQLVRLALQREQWSSGTGESHVDGSHGDGYCELHCDHHDGPVNHADTAHQDHTDAPDTGQPDGARLDPRGLKVLQQFGVDVKPLQKLSFLELDAVFRELKVPGQVEALLGMPGHEFRADGTLGFSGSLGFHNDYGKFHSDAHQDFDRGHVDFAAEPHNDIHGDSSEPFGDHPDVTHPDVHDDRGQHIDFHLDHTDAGQAT